MKKLALLTAVVLLAAAVACIADAAVRVCRALWGMGKADPEKKRGDFWGGIAFHGATAVLALWLFLKALGKT